MRALFTGGLHALGDALQSVIYSDPMLLIQGFALPSGPPAEPWFSCRFRPRARLSPGVSLSIDVVRRIRSAVNSPGIARSLSAQRKVKGEANTTGRVVMRTLRSARKKTGGPYRAAGWRSAGSARVDAAFSREAGARTAAGHWRWPKHWSRPAPESDCASGWRSLPRSPCHGSRFRPHWCSPTARSAS